MTRRAGAFPGLPVRERAEELLLQASLRFADVRAFLLHGAL